MLKYLRIGVTGLSLTACGLLITLWVRSYWCHDMFETGFNGSANWIVQSFRGQTILKFVNHANEVWHWEVTPAENAGIYLLVPLAESWEVPTVAGIGLTSVQDGVIVAIPYPIVVGLSAALAIAAWLPWRFSLRALLIAMTLVAVGLGVIALAR